MSEHGPQDDAALEWACQVMHDAYEEAAGPAGWHTNPDCRVPWADVPEANKVTMRAAMRVLLDQLGGPLPLAPKAAPSSGSPA